MGAENAWAKLYGVAVLETDWLNIGHSIQAAEDSIRARLHEFSLDHGGTLEENKAIENALHGLDTLRKDVIAYHRRLARDATTARVLVVEDHEPFQRFVCSTLGKTSALQIVDQVSDGLQAVRRAEELQPDLIVLDIGLPSLNGIEVARRVRQLSPNSKILFLSQESCPDVVQAALRSGASGYVLKSQAGADLLRALETIREGRLFVSTVLLARDDHNTTPPQVTLAGLIPSLEA